MLTAMVTKRGSLLLVTMLSLVHRSYADTTTTPCPILGPPFPKPQRLDTSRAFQRSIKAFDRAIDQGLNDGSTEKFGSFAFNKTTFSVGIFSIYNDDLLHEYHYTSSEIANGTAGARKADSNSIYRIGSISKLLTVYTFLVQEGFARFEDPVTKYLPELARASQNLTSSNGKLADWTEVTIGDISAQLSGSPRDLALNDLPEFPGAPDLSPDQISECDRFDVSTGVYKECSGQQYLQGIAKLPALWVPGHTPTYNNAAYALLGLIIERITGKPFSHLLQKKVIERLALNGTTFLVPDSPTHAIIPVNETISRWATDLGALNPSGSFYSSTYDLAKIGKSIMNASLLTRAVTNRWLKPRTFTPDFRSSGGMVGVGAPFEIHVIVGDGRVTELYTKGGDWGAYHTFFVLVPDYGIGFSVLTASASVSGVREGIVALVADIVLPGIAHAARNEADDRFTGTYRANDGVNSSVTIATDQYPGLRVTEFMSNGTDQLSAWATYASGGTPAGKYADLRLFPNQLYDDGNQAGFTGSWNLLPREQDPFWSGCNSWLTAGTPTWGSLALGDFIFEFNGNGTAVRARPRAYHITLERV